MFLWIFQGKNSAPNRGNFTSYGEPSRNNAQHDKLENPFCQCFEFCVSVLCLSYQVAHWTVSDSLCKKPNSVSSAFFFFKVSDTFCATHSHGGRKPSWESGGDKLCHKLVNIFFILKNNYMVMKDKQVCIFWNLKEKSFKLKMENRHRTQNIDGMDFRTAIRLSYW